MKRSRKRQASTATAVAPERFPALQDFLSGYLHQDFVDAHGTPEGAVRAFFADAQAGDAAQLQRETASFASTIRDWPWRDASRAVRTLGSAWAPSSRSALKSVLTAIRHAAPRRGGESG